MMVLVMMMALVMMMTMMMVQTWYCPELYMPVYTHRFILIRDAYLQTSEFHQATPNPAKASGWKIKGCPRRLTTT